MMIAIIVILILVILFVAVCKFLERINRPEKEQLQEGKRGILCIGDSITFGTGVMLSRKEECWVYLLAKQFPGWQALNYGCAGATCMDSGDKPYRQQDLLEAARDTGAEIAVIMLGTNDSKPQNWDPEGYKAELKRLVTEVKGWKSICQTILMAPPAAFCKKGKDTAVYGIRGEIIANEVYQIVCRTAEECGVQCIDLYTLTKDHPEYFGDGVHPNTLGNQKIAEHVAAQMQLQANMKN